MKLVTAVIKPYKLDDVKAALQPSASRADRQRGPGLRPAEGPHRGLPGCRVHGGLRAEDPGRGPRRRDRRRQGRRRDRRGGPDRQDRRRQGLGRPRSTTSSGSAPASAASTRCKDVHVTRSRDGQPARLTATAEPGRDRRTGLGRRGSAVRGGAPSARSVRRARRLAGRGCRRRAEPGVALVAVGGLGRRRAAPRTATSTWCCCTPGRPATSARSPTRSGTRSGTPGSRLDHSVRTHRRGARASPTRTSRPPSGCSTSGTSPATRRSPAALREPAARPTGGASAPRQPARSARAHRARWRQHGELAFLLEGDLKEARGGLRDVRRAARRSPTPRSPTPGGRRCGPPTPACSTSATCLHLVGRPRAATGCSSRTRTTSPQLLGLPDAEALLRRVADDARTIAYARRRLAARGRAAGSPRSATAAAGRARRARPGRPGRGRAGRRGGARPRPPIAPRSTRPCRCGSPRPPPGTACRSRPRTLEWLATALPAAAAPVAGGGPGRVRPAARRRPGAGVEWEALRPVRPDRPRGCPSGRGCAARRSTTRSTGTPSTGTSSRRPPRPPRYARDVARPDLLLHRRAAARHRQGPARRPLDRRRRHRGQHRARDRTVARRTWPRSAGWSAGTCCCPRWRPAATSATRRPCGTWPRPSATSRPSSCCTR